MDPGPVFAKHTSENALLLHQNDIQHMGLQRFIEKVTRFSKDRKPPIPRCVPMNEGLYTGFYFIK